MAQYEVKGVVIPEIDITLYVGEMSAISDFHSGEVNRTEVGASMRVGVPDSDVEFMCMASGLPLDTDSDIEPETQIMNMLANNSKNKGVSHLVSSNNFVDYIFRRSRAKSLVGTLGGLVTGFGVTKLAAEGTRDQAASFWMLTVAGALAIVSSLKHSREQRRTIEGKIDSIASNAQKSAVLSLIFQEGVVFEPTAETNEVL